MPDQKITELPVKTSLDDNDLIPVVDRTTLPYKTSRITLENAKTALTGPKGDTGASFPFKGDWATSTVYAVNDCVYYNGSGYVCIAPHTSGVFATDLASLCWNIFVQKGEKGDIGDTGATGATGANIDLLYGTSETPPAADDGTLYVTYEP